MAGEPESTAADTDWVHCPYVGDDTQGLFFAKKACIDVEISRPTM
jgi:hypothetical protein